MPTDPLTGSRYPSATAAPNVNQDIQNAVMDLADNTTPRFATTTARDTAYTAYVAAGGTLSNGMSCWCDTPGAFYDRIAGAWERRVRTKVGADTVTVNASGDWSITHGMGVVPTVAHVQARNINAFGGSDWAVNVLTSTTIGGRVYYNNAPQGATTMNVFWTVSV